MLVNFTQKNNYQAQKLKKVPAEQGKKTPQKPSFEGKIGLYLAPEATDANLARFKRDIFNFLKLENANLPDFKYLVKLFFPDFNFRLIDAKFKTDTFKKRPVVFAKNDFSFKIDSMLNFIKN